MISNISDFIIVLVVGLLLLSGQKDVGNTIKNLGKALTQLKRTQEEFRQELIRELNGLGDVVEETRKSVVTDLTPNYSRVSKIQTPPVKIVSNTSDGKEDRIKQLEEEIKRLQLELERLKQNGSKN